MPVAKIHVLEGQYDEARIGKVSSAVQKALIGTLGIPPEDFFQIIHVLPRSRYLHTRSFLGLTYTDDLIVLEITFISGRPKEQRKRLLKALNDSVSAAAGVPPDEPFDHVLRDSGREYLIRSRSRAASAHFGASPKPVKRQTLSATCRVACVMVAFSRRRFASLRPIGPRPLDRDRLGMFSAALQ
jgi:hypothetical protein